MMGSIFLNGLKEEIQVKLKLYDNHDLADVMDRALLIEGKNEVMERKSTGWKDRGGTYKFKDPGEVCSAKTESGKKRSWTH